jgi:hypothetical protein
MTKNICRNYISASNDGSDVIEQAPGAVTPDAGLAAPLPDHFEQAHCRCGRHVERFDRARHRNPDPQSGSGLQLSANPLPFGAENPGQHAFPTRIVE